MRVPYRSSQVQKPVNEVLICSCGAHHTVRSFVGSEKASRSLDHPEFMKLYGNGQQSSVTSASIDLEPGSAPLHNAWTRQTARSNSSAATSSSIMGDRVASTKSDSVTVSPCSPTEIKVSTWKSGANQNGSEPHSWMLHELSGQPFNQIRDQEWPIKEIIGARKTGNEREFQICWAESIFHHTYLNESADGKCFVVIEGVKWDIESHEIVESDDPSVQSCIVKWPATWKPERELLNARELIDEFDRQTAKQVASPARDKPRDSIEQDTPIIGNTPPSAEVQSEGLEDWEHVPARSYKVPALKFKPQLDEEYHGSDFREVIARGLGAAHSLLKLWQPDMDQRTLVFRRTFVESDRGFNLTRREKRRAVLDYICGVEQRKQCECCANGSGPFAKCIVAPDSTYSACTNCSCSASAKRCNFHHESLKEHWPYALEQILTPPPSSPLSESPIDLGSSSPPYRTEPSPELGDPHFYLTPPPRVTGTDPVEDASSVHRTELDPASIDERIVLPTEEEPPSRSKRSSPFEPDSSTSKIADTGSSLPIRPAKSRRLSNVATPSHFRLRAEVAFCVSTAMAIWRPISFRHPGCGADVSSLCLETEDYPPMDLRDEREACQAADRVISGRHFITGEATDAEVRYILRRCPCSFVESFREGWQTWTHVTGIHCMQESFLSQFYVKKLNEAIDKFCQYRIQHLMGIPVVVLE